MAYTYQDVDLSFGMNPATNDLLKKFDDNAVRQWFGHLLKTDQGEIPTNPFYGIGIYQLMFEMLDPVVVSAVKRNIIQQTLAFVPELSISNVDLIDNDDELIINIVYTVQGNPAQKSISFSFTRSL